MNFVLYHANCQDGLGAKYAAWKKFGDGGAVYLPVQYGEEIPDAVFGSVATFGDLEINDQFYDPSTASIFVKTTKVVATLKYQDNEEEWEYGLNFVFDDDEPVYRSGANDVYIVDFSYPLKALAKLGMSSRTLVILDHHKTAQEALKDFPGAIFDMNKSGAMLAWEYFHPDKQPPKLIEYVQDRDLWKKKFPETDIIAGALPLLQGDMQRWDDAAMNNDCELHELYQNGLIIDQYKTIKVTEGLKAVKVLPYRGYKAGVRNYTDNASDMGEAIYNNLKADMAMTYFVDNDGVVTVSFRSKQEGGPDVGALAKELGGGGHKNASGARVDLDFLSNLLAGKL
jgi:uncharacterized protein